MQAKRPMPIFFGVLIVCYFLIALAPLALAPLLVLRARGARDRVLAVCGAGLLVVPVVIAVVLTVLAESISLE